MSRQARSNNKRLKLTANVVLYHRRQQAAAELQRYDVHRGKSGQQVQRRKEVASQQCRALQLVPARRGVDPMLAAHGPPGEPLGAENRVGLIQDTDGHRLCL
jgi:hypothetical protein